LNEALAADILASDSAEKGQTAAAFARYPR
jgi:hypothetical protein